MSVCHAEAASPFFEFSSSRKHDPSATGTVGGADGSPRGAANSSCGSSSRWFWWRKKNTLWPPRAAEVGRELRVRFIVELVLVAEEDHLVPHQSRADRSDRGLVEVAAEPHIANFGADPPHHGDDIERAVIVSHIVEMMDQRGHGGSLV